MAVSLSDTYWSIYPPLNQQIDIKTKLQVLVTFTIDVASLVVSGGFLVVPIVSREFA
jgi:hypothetical protein